MAKHAHHSCEHELAWCRHCNVAYCQRCDMQWERPCTRAHYYPWYGVTYPAISNTYNQTAPTDQTLHTLVTCNHTN